MFFFFNFLLEGEKGHSKINIKLCARGYYTHLPHRAQGKNRTSQYSRVKTEWSFRRVFSMEHCGLHASDHGA